MNKLNVKALGLSLGILWSCGILIMGIITIFSNWGMDFVTLIGSVYVGYQSTWVGAPIGAVWAFVDGAVCGALIAWLYNKFSG